MQLKTDIIAQSVGTNTLNSEGYTLGQIAEITYRDDGSQMKYIIIGTDYFHGQGYRYFAIPVCPELIKITEDQEIIIHATREELKRARGLRYEKCPEPHVEFSITIYELLGYEPKNKKTVKVNN